LGAAASSSTSTKAAFDAAKARGSHNATLKEHGVDQMVALKGAFIPVDEEEAKKKRRGRTPVPDPIAALEQTAPGIVLRTDQKPAKTPNNVVIGENYFEIQL
jgi:hypothetical protein